MTQDTTVEFGHRLVQAVEGHPLAPLTPHGRQRWLLDKLVKETKVSVSPNTMSKWFNGTARPRPDNIRELARVLKVDEVWLTIGRKPTDSLTTMHGMEKANGSALLLAGMIETTGGKVTFPAGEESVVDLHVNMTGQRFDVVVCQARERGSEVDFLVSEPVRGARVIAVVLTPAETTGTASVSLYDLTDVPRQTLGGFSVVTMERRAEGKFKVAGERALVAPLKSMAAVTA
jgi:hypothetical protein